MAFQGRKKLHKVQKTAPVRSYTTYGSLALAPEEVYTPAEETKAPARRSRKQPEVHVIHRAKLFLALAVVFVGAIVTTVSYAVVEEQKVVNQELLDELGTLQMANQALRAEVTEQMNLDFVEKEATQRLGMSEPQSYQLVYIDVPKESYTIRYAEEVEESPGIFSLASIMNLFK